MSLRIFETDPDALPKPREMFADDVVGRFRSGRMAGKAPESLSEWRVTTGDPSVAKAISEMMGGEPAEWETSREDNIEILTETSSVSIIIDNSDGENPAITSKMVLWGMGGVKIHECDGVEFLDEKRYGQPCGCPALLAERKDAARDGHGPKPEVSVRFRLAENPELGMFRFQSASWDLVRVLHEIENALDDVDGPARATLRLEPVEFTAKSGQMAGRKVSYRKPSIRVNGPVQQDSENIPF